MAAVISPTTGRRYGIAQVCRIWDVPRSSFYADRRRADTTRTPVSVRRRGPKPVVSDDTLLAAIRADLARSPWHGEGHRKVWAELA
jgi:putative transposase